MASGCVWGTIDHFFISRQWITAFKLLLSWTAASPNLVCYISFIGLLLAKASSSNWTPRKGHNQPANQPKRLHTQKLNHHHVQFKMVPAKQSPITKMSHPSLVWRNEWRWCVVNPLRRAPQKSTSFQSNLWWKIKRKVAITKSHIGVPDPTDKSPERSSWYSALLVQVRVLWSIALWTSSWGLSGKTIFTSSWSQMKQTPLELLRHSARPAGSLPTHFTRWKIHLFPKADHHRYPTRGLKQDKKITSQIKQFFSIPDKDGGIDHLDGIGFVTQASLARLTPTQKYIFDLILATFAKTLPATSSRWSLSQMVTNSLYWMQLMRIISHSKNTSSSTIPLCSQKVTRRMNRLVKMMTMKIFPKCSGRWVSEFQDVL